jgi:hypothetical protein
MKFGCFVQFLSICWRHNGGPCIDPVTLSHRGTKKQRKIFVVLCGAASFPGSFCLPPENQCGGKKLDLGGKWNLTGSTQ